MTYTSSNGASAPDKSLFIQSQISAVALEAGLVRHPLVSATDQVRILRAIDAKGSTTIGAAMAALGAHADPVGAIFTLIRAGLVETRLVHGVLDENAVLIRAGATPGDEGDGMAGEGLELPSGPKSPPLAGMAPAPLVKEIVEALSSDEENDLIDLHAVDSTLPEGIAALSICPLLPRLHVGSGAARRSFAALADHQRPGVYILLSDTRAYVGMGSMVGRRVASGAQPIEDVDTIITITDAHDGLDDADAAVLERLMHMRVSAASEVRLLNGTPGGAPVSPERYEALAVMASLACDALAREGHLFINMSRRLALAGPRAERGQLAPLRPFSLPPEGEVMELAFGRNLVALAARRAEDDWLLLAGSDVRLDTVASANASASYLRAAWLHSGILELSENGENYVLTRDMVFRSGGAAMHFAIGSKGQGRGGWRSVEQDAESALLDEQELLAAV